MQADRQNSCLSDVTLARRQWTVKKGVALPTATQQQMLAQPGTEKQVLSFDLLPAARTKSSAHVVAQHEEVLNN